MSACTLQTSKYWIIKCWVSGGEGAVQLPAFRLSTGPTRPHVPVLFKTEPVARRVAPTLHVCAGTRAPSQLIACDSLQSPGPLKHHNLVVLAYGRSNMPAEGGEEGTRSVVILHTCRHASVLAQSGAMKDTIQVNVQGGFIDSRCSCWFKSAAAGEEDPEGQTADDAGPRSQPEPLKSLALSPRPVIYLRLSTYS